jgi:hypothetical protein
LPSTVMFPKLYLVIRFCGGESVKLFIALMLENEQVLSFTDVPSFRDPNSILETGSV